MVQPPGEEFPADPLQLRHLLTLLAEALHNAYAGHGSVDDPGDCGCLALGVPSGGEELGAAAISEEPQGGRDGEGDQREQRRQEEHHDQ
jgi:hypothetical protein